jgi:hypothetical protein
MNLCGQLHCVANKEHVCIAAHDSYACCVLKKPPVPLPTAKGEPRSANISRDAIALVKDIVSYHNLCYEPIDSCKVRINLTRNSWNKLRRLAQQHPC